MFFCNTVYYDNICCVNLPLHVENASFKLVTLCVLMESWTASCKLQTKRTTLNKWLR